MKYYVRVQNDAYGYVTERGDPNDRWSADSTATDNNVTGIEVVKENDFYDLVVDFDPTKEPSYLLYVIYDTGDSFSNHDGLIEYVQLYKDKSVAFENKRRIEQHYKLYDDLNSRFRLTEKQRKELKKKHKDFDAHSIMLVHENGEEYKLHVPWTGYFETMQEVEVKEVC